MVDPGFTPFCKGFLKNQSIVIPLPKKFLLKSKIGCRSNKRACGRLKVEACMCTNTPLLT